MTGDVLAGRQSKVTGAEERARGWRETEKKTR